MSAAVYANIYPRHLFLTTGVPTGQNDLKLYLRSLSEAERGVRKVALKVSRLLEKTGRSRGQPLNVGITPEDGQLGMVIELSSADKSLTDEEKNRFGMALAGSDNVSIPSCLVKISA